MKTKTSILAILAIAGGSLVASAQGKPGDGERPDREEMRAKMEERRKAMLAEFDTNGNGKIDEGAERDAVKAAMEQRKADLLDKYDANDNGKLDRDEIKTAREAGEKLPMMRPGGKRGPRGEGEGKGKGRPPGGKKGGPGGKKGGPAAGGGGGE